MEIRPCPLYVFLDPKGWIFWLHGFWIFFFPLERDLTQLEKFYSSVFEILLRFNTICRLSCSHEYH